MSLKVGDKVPDFTLPVVTKEGKKEFKLSEHLGKGDVVLSFFPLAFSGTCTQQMCDVRDHYSEIEGVSAAIFGFSADSSFTNRAFIEKNNLSQPIISDPNREVLPKIWHTATVAGVNNVARRGVMILDSRGVVKYVWDTPDPAVRPPYEEIAKNVGSR